MTHAPCGGTVAYVNQARNRNNTVAGSRLVARLLRRVSLAGAITAAAASLAWIGSAQTSRLILGFLVAFAMLSFGYLLFYSLHLIGDYHEKRRLADKYGCEIRFGLDTYQRRVMRIVSPPADLPRRVSQALEALAGDAEIQQTNANRFEAKLPRRGKQLQCHVTVQLGPDQENTIIVTVESRLTEPLGFTDLGRNIANVEEFQSALLRLLGAEVRSAAVAPELQAR